MIMMITQTMPKQFIVPHLSFIHLRDIKNTSKQDVNSKLKLPGLL